MIKKNIYFPNLNGLRFIAAFLVIIHHIEQVKNEFGLETYWNKFSFVTLIGKLGVVIFFVLSGFLITYLLLTEESVKKTINIKSFYMRRILRIWPLYFLIIFLALAVFPHFDIFSIPSFVSQDLYSNIYTKVILYMLMLPNFVGIIYGIVPYASQAWSIGVEEQFYVIWPLLLCYIKKHRVILMCSIIVGHGLVRLALESSLLDWYENKVVLEGLWSLFSINAMAIGGLLALLLFEKKRILEPIINDKLFYILSIITLGLVAKGIQIPYVHTELYALFFGIIILNLAVNPKIKISLENKLFNYLGKISYGLYMYHLIAITLSIQICLSIGIVSNWLIYPITLLFSVVMAGLSYRYFEKSFLKHKAKFIRIQSGIQSKSA